MDVADSPCPCTTEYENTEEVEEELFSAQLTNVALDDAADDTLADALEDLRKAMKLYQDGMCLEAAEKLAAAESLIEKSPESRGRKSLMAVVRRNPDLKDIRSSARFSEDAVSTNLDALTSETSGDQYSFHYPPAGVSSDRSSEQITGAMSLDSNKIATSSEEEDLLRKMEELEHELAQVRAFCRNGRIFEAHRALTALQADLEATHRLAAQDPECSATNFLQGLKQKLKVDPVLMKLRSVHKRMSVAHDMLQKPGGTKGVTLELKDPLIGEHFRMEMRIRFAEGAEREKNGPACQLIVRCTVHNYPASLLQSIIADCEADLMRREWIKDATHLNGKPGRPARLYCAQMHTTMSPPMLPIKLDDVIFREFAVCDGEGELPNIGPGVLVVEYRAPVGVKEFEGMPIPGKKSGTVRISNGQSFFYKTQSKHPGCSNFEIVATVGLSVPQMILPLSLIKSFAANAIRESFISLKTGLFDRWEENQQKEREASCPELYDQVRNIPPDKRT